MSTSLRQGSGKTKVIHAARILLGVVFVVFGLNGFLHFIPSPPLPAAAAPFVSGLFGTPYFLPLLKGTEIVAGTLLLANRLVPLALTVLAPIVVNIVAFHLFLAPGGLPIVIVVLALEIFLARAYAHVFLPMLAVRVEPRAAAPEPTLAPAPR